MKNFFRFLGILILIIILVVVVLGLIAPKDVTMERSVVIKGPKSVVRDQMFKYENFTNWNPFDDEDPNMKYEVTPDGNKYSWSGNDKVGSGEMTTKEMSDNQKTYDMHFITPFESNADGYYKLEDMGNGETKAIWGFHTHMNFPMNGISMLMGMKKMLTTSFDKGLNDLKAYVESGKAGTGSSFMIQEVQYPGGTYATIRETVSFSNLDNFFGKAYEKLGKAAGQRIAGVPIGLYYTWDQEHMKTDAAAGFPVSGTDAVTGAEMVTLPASGAYMVVYTGGYMGSAKAHEALGQHLAANGKESSLVLEEYIKGPGDEADSNMYVTNIYYLLK